LGEQHIKGLAVKVYQSSTNLDFWAQKRVKKFGLTEKPTKVPSKSSLGNNYSIHFEIMKLLCIFFATAILFSCKERNAETNAVFEKVKEAKGCGDIILFGVVYYDKLLRIHLDYQKTTFSTEMQIYSNIAEESFADISIEQNKDLDKLWQNVCNDVIETPSQTSTDWKLTSGKLSYKINKIPAQFGCFETYEATLVLENAVFEDGKGNQLTMDKAAFDQVTVGLCGG
jgi:hypothetical protein